MAEVAAVAAAAVLVTCAVATNQHWLDRHFLPSFLFPREWYVRLELIARLSMAIAGSCLVRLTPRIGRLAARAPSGLASVSVAAVLALGASEPALRRMHLQPTEWLWPDEEPLRVADARLGWTLAAGRVGHVVAGSQVLEYAIDPSGYRVRNAQHPVDFSRPAVLFTGESVMFGEGLTWDESVPGRVEALLGTAAAVLAVHGFGNDQAYLRLESELPRFEHPRAVVSLFTTTLFGRNLDQRRPHLGRGLRWAGAVPEWRLQSLARLIVPYHGDAVIDEGVEVTREVLRATARLARARGATPLILVPQFGPEDDAQRALRRRVVDESGVPFVLVQMDSSWRLPWNRHPDARAAQAMAEAVTNRLWALGSGLWALGVEGLKPKAGSILQQLIQIEQHLHPGPALRHALHVAGVDALAELGRRLDLLGHDVHHLVHAVHHHAESARSAAERRLHDDDARPSGHGRLETELEAEIDDGNHAAAQVDHPFDVGRHLRHLRNLHHLDDFAYPQDRQRVFLVAEREGQILAGRRNRQRRHD
ncbi:MAG TPA: hypothetical protein VGQ37_00135 [Vicinamibacterales bacterium]|nr:hypothetical protein [Vicinamibacterales bacterium]